ncbi:hypothetical protein LQZ19_01080 [Treponema primitia]|uniref:hypothetical protein n=1 Tax=Treponema primitia TaxID=88058 RepID=UPI00397F9D80
MAQCVKCGKKGLFLKVNTEGLCEACVVLPPPPPQEEPEPVILGNLEGFWGIPWGANQETAEQILYTKGIYSTNGMTSRLNETRIRAGAVFGQKFYAGFDFEEACLYFHAGFYQGTVKFNQHHVTFESLYDKIKEKYGNGRVVSTKIRLGTSTPSPETCRWDFENGSIELSIETGFNNISTFVLSYTEKNIEKKKQEWEQALAAKQKAEREAKEKADL